MSAVERLIALSGPVRVKGYTRGDGTKVSGYLRGTTKAPGMDSGLATAIPTTISTKRLGECYVLSGRKVMDNPGSSLIHGTIQGDGFPPLDHAWVELPGGIPWEPASDTKYTPDAFKKLFHPVVKKRYSFGDAMHQMSKYKHFGPWPEDG